MLTKSHYKIAKQCQKALWLHENKADAVIKDEKNEAVLENGKIVGQCARGLLPGGSLVDFDGDVQKALITTSKLINEGCQTIYEAAFTYDKYLAICDILHKGSNGWEVYEIKSGTECNPEYIEDVVFQYNLLKMLGMNISKVSIVYINNQYERIGDLNLKELFVVQDVTEEVSLKVQNITDELNEIIYMLERLDEPQIKIGEYCLKPYDCDCKGYCWCDIPEYSVFDIAGMRKNKMFQMYEQGIVTFEDIASSVKLSSNSATIQVEAHLNNRKIQDNDGIGQFLDTIFFPLYFLDFETFQQAIPEFDMQKPYEQIPFQYSLHYFENQNGELNHKEYLAKEGVDPRYELAQSLVNDIPKDVCVMAYNMQFEKMVISRLAQQFPEFSEHLRNIHDNIIDLMTPFQKKQYYLKEMKGSHSIKYVLPALFPDDDEMNYKKLNIQNGSMAMQTFAVLTLKTDEEIEKIRRDLLDYCKLDTLAMVKIWQKLIEILKIS